jgi:hypothetical protein
LNIKFTIFWTISPEKLSGSTIDSIGPAPWHLIRIVDVCAAVEGLVVELEWEDARLLVGRVDLGDKARTL